MITIFAKALHHYVVYQVRGGGPSARDSRGGGVIFEATLHSVLYMIFYPYIGGWRGLWEKCFPVPLADAPPPRRRRQVRACGKHKRLFQRNGCASLCHLARTGDARAALAPAALLPRVPAPPPAALHSVDHMLRTP